MGRDRGAGVVGVVSEAAEERATDFINEHRCPHVEGLAAVDCHTCMSEQFTAAAQAARDEAELACISSIYELRRKREKRGAD